MDECDVSASGSLWSNVAHHHAPRATGETSVGDQAYAFAQTSTNQGTGGCQHFRHTWPAFGAEVTQNHDIACFDLAVQDGFERRLLVVKHAGWASDDGVFQASNFGDGAFGREVAFQNGQMALLIHGLVDSADDVLVGAWGVWNISQVFGHGFAGDGHAVAMQQAGFEQNFHDLRDAASAV